MMAPPSPSEASPVSLLAWNVLSVTVAGPRAFSITAPPKRPPWLPTKLLPDTTMDPAVFATSAPPNEEASLPSLTEPNVLFRTWIGSLAEGLNETAPPAPDEPGLLLPRNVLPTMVGAEVPSIRIAAPPPLPSLMFPLRKVSPLIVVAPMFPPDRIGV